MVMFGAIGTARCVTSRHLPWGRSIASRMQPLKIMFDWCGKMKKTKKKQIAAAFLSLHNVFEFARFRKVATRATCVRELKKKKSNAGALLL
ncbi:MAG: hypothetical protein CL798_00590 [Chromatiales bacterium]|nr:hypothetical protein [Chromatiales bacterium]